MKLLKSTILLFVLIVLQVTVPASPVLADTGPKPSMEFTFVQEAASAPLTIVSGILLECDQADCSDAAPIEEVGPQGFYCDAQSCSATAYGFAPYHRIEIEFSDGQTRTSNVFETAGFDSSYDVTVRPDDLLVESRFTPTNLFPRNAILLLCICAFFIGLLVLAVILFVVRRRRTA